MSLAFYSLCESPWLSKLLSRAISYRTSVSSLTTDASGAQTNPLFPSPLHALIPSLLCLSSPSSLLCIAFALRPSTTTYSVPLESNQLSGPVRFPALTPLSLLSNHCRHVVPFAGISDLCSSAAAAMRGERVVKGSRRVSNSGTRKWMPDQRVQARCSPGGGRTR
jgi:hypothetical protein